MPHPPVREQVLLDLPEQLLAGLDFAKRVYRHHDLVPAPRPPERGDGPVHARIVAGYAAVVLGGNGPQQLALGGVRREHLRLIQRLGRGPRLRGQRIPGLQ